MPLFSNPSTADRWARFSHTTVRAFHVYGTWLTGISWMRFFVLAVLLMVCLSVLQNIPPFSWSFTESITIEPPAPPKPPKPPQPQAQPKVSERGAATSQAGDGQSINISIDERGVRILKQPHASASAASAVTVLEINTPAPQASAPATVDIQAGDQQVHIHVPAGADSQAVREAVEEARQAIVEAIEDAHQAAAESTVKLDTIPPDEEPGSTLRVHRIRLGDFLSDLGALWIFASAILKITYKGRIQAEVKAAQATETAEAESLKRQVVEARMAAMQAQVEPHFLFNTLASIDHLIETDPPRASQMQKNLIALLRASMPTLRDTADGAARDLGRELAVVRPYIEILKVRMEDRLDASIEAPEGLLSAEFPAMMIQTLVENAIRHGLEPKPEGGQLRVRAEIIHGKLTVTVADTGVGFGAAGTSGTGVGLANIRERLQLLHGNQASLTVTANSPTGTVVTIAVPYRTVVASASAGFRPAAAATTL